LKEGEDNGDNEDTLKAWIDKKRTRKKIVMKVWINNKEKTMEIMEML
jgi:uncharacterized protein YheU (UPF0270 family)